MPTISNAPAAIILAVTVVFLLVLARQINPATRTARSTQNVLWMAAINVAAVGGMYAAWAWAPLNVALEFRTWAKLVDGLAAFGVAAAMISLHRAIKR